MDNDEYYKKLEQQPLPDYIHTVIANTNKEYIEKEFNDINDNIHISQIIYYFSFIGEQFALQLQQRLIENKRNNINIPLSTNPIPKFINDVKLKTLFLFSERYQIQVDSKEFNQYNDYLSLLSYRIIELIINRNK